MTARLPKQLRRQSAVHAAFEAEMNSGAPIVDMIGDGRMEYDGPRCAGDCGAAVDSEGAQCPDCIAITSAEVMERELRLVIDEDCPRCDWPERFFAPGRGVFGCTRRRPEPCGYESTERAA